MKYKKYSYILVLILMLLVGINTTYAAESKMCYYISEDDSFKSSLKLSWGYNRLWLGINFETLNDYVSVSVDKVGEEKLFDNEIIINWWKRGFNNLYTNCTASGNTCFEPYYKNETAANKANNPNCPKYLVYQHVEGEDYYIWATESESLAKKAVEDIKNSGRTGYYASYKKNGEVITVDEYYAEFIDEGIVEIDDGEPTCVEYEAIFGELNDDGETYDPDGDKQPSIRYYVNQVLQYVRVIVPILIILLGTVDFAKAVLAGKEDNMRKAQSDFIKRVLIGVAVFFVPLLVDVVMWLADIVWEGRYIHCDLY